MLQVHYSTASALFADVLPTTWKQMERDEWIESCSVMEDFPHVHHKCSGPQWSIRRSPRKRFNLVDGDSYTVMQMTCIERRVHKLFASR